MNILVTGGAGFVGQHVVSMLEHQEHKAWVIDRKNGHEIKEMDSIPHNTDAIIHCAAKADISQNWTSFEEREEIWRDNCEALRVLLELALNSRIKTFVFVSTGAVYGSTRWQIANEERACQATSPYVASKLMGEAFVEAYALKAGWKWHVARLVSCVGKGYRHGHIADFVRKIKEHGSFEALDDGNSPKEFVHVRDAARALVKMATGDIPSGIFNVTSGKLWSWKDTVRIMGNPEHTWSKRKEGWLGDPVGLRLSQEAISPWWRAMYSIESGVEEALEDLGWPRSR